ncbi:MAG: response regulator [Marinilabiliaceae bacterium]|nr:response regulator [Marinilabiliaceae bacterium]
MKIIIIVILSLLFAASALGQQDSFSVQTLDTTNGIASPVSFSVVKDRHGFIWVSTRLGIDRYDGLHFKHYSLTKSNMRLSDEGVRYDIFPNTDNGIYVYSDLGKIFLYNEDTDAFEELYCFTEHLGGHSLHAFSIEPSCLILGLYNGIVIFDRTTQTITSRLCSDTNIRCIISFINGTYLVGSEKGLYLLDLAKKSCELIACPELDIISLYYDAEQQRIWLGTKGKGLWTMRLDNTDIKQIQNYEHAIVTSIAPYADSQLLVGVDGDGLLVTSRIFISSLRSATDASLNASSRLPSVAIQNVFVDKNNIWLASYDCGLIMLSTTVISNILQHPTNHLQSDIFCHGLDCTSNNGIWAAYNRCICHYPNAQSQPRLFLNESTSFLTIKQTSDNSVWCGGYNSGLYRLDPASGNFNRIASLSHANVNSSIYAIGEDNNHNLWVGGHNFPLSRISNIIGRPIGTAPDADDIKQYPISRVNDLAILNDSTVVAGAVNGLFIVNPIQNSVREFLSSNIIGEWDCTNFITSLAPLSDHSLAIGTDGAGVILFDLLTETMTPFTVSSHNLPSNYIRSIEYVGNNHIWVSTDNSGIFSFDTNSQVVDNRLPNTTLHSNYFFSSSSTNANGNIFFGGELGVEMISSSNIPNDNHSISILLSEVGIDNENRISHLSHPDVLQEPVHSASNINLPYGEKSLRLRFTTDDIYHQNILLMEYLLDNDKENWTPLNNERELNLFSLPVGLHHLTIRCTSSNGEHFVKMFSINALQTRWLQTPAIILYVFLFLCFIFGCIMLYIKHIKSNIADEKIRFFNNVAHDIRTPLSLVTATASEIEQFLSPETPANIMPVFKHNINHLANVVNQLSLFNDSPGSSNTLCLTAIPLCELVRSLYQAYYPLANQKSLSLDIATPDSEVWVEADEASLIRICDNVLGNAFKFTVQGGIHITVAAQGKYGIIEIKDSGIGMSDDTKKKLFRHFFRGKDAIQKNISGFGLGMMYSNIAIQKMNGRISCQSEVNKGSAFSIALPLTTPVNDKATPIEITNISPLSFPIDSHYMYSGYRHDILIVEDSNDLRKYLSDRLQVGYNVHAVASVEDAKAYLSNHSTDLIISDIVLPGMQGDEWCKELKNNFETEHIPVFLLTAKSQYNDRLNSLANGADEYIIKPFDINVLLLKIRNVFEARHHLRTYYMHTLEVNPKQPRPSQSVNENPKNTQRELDNQFMAQLMAVIDKYISRSDLSVEDLSKEIAMSHTLFYNKIQKLFGISPAALIRNCRMKKAKELITTTDYSIAEIALMCGFSDTKYFSISFKKFYGQSPSQLRKL